MDLSSNRKIEVYIKLMDEPVDVWRPTQALDLGNKTFKVLPTTNYNPEDEEWEFIPGSVVRLEERVNETGSFLVAVSSAT